MPSWMKVSTHATILGWVRDWSICGGRSGLREAAVVGSDTPRRKSLGNELAAAEPEQLVAWMNLLTIFLSFQGHSRPPPLCVARTANACATSPVLGCAAPVSARLGLQLSRLSLRRRHATYIDLLDHKVLPGTSVLHLYGPAKGPLPQHLSLAVWPAGAVLAVGHRAASAAGPGGGGRVGGTGLEVGGGGEVGSGRARGSPPPGRRGGGRGAARPRDGGGVGEGQPRPLPKCSRESKALSSILVITRRRRRLRRVRSPSREPRLRTLDGRRAAPR